MTDQRKTLYDRLGGYNAIAAFADDLLPRLQVDPSVIAQFKTSLGTCPASVPQLTPNHSPEPDPQLLLPIPPIPRVLGAA